MPDINSQNNVSSMDIADIQYSVDTQFKSLMTQERELAMELEEQGIKRFTLYDGEVVMDFKADSPKYRYVVTDARTGLDKQSTRGVTTVIRDILDKPGLRTWPLNMANGFLFGAKFNEEVKKYLYTAKEAAIKPDTSYKEEQLQKLMDAGSRQWTKRSDRGKDIGHMVHSTAELYLKGEKKPVETVLAEFEPKKPLEEQYAEIGQYVAAENTWKENYKDWQAISKEVKKAFGAFKSWWDSIPNKKLISVEKPIYSRSMRYAGTFDLAVEIDGMGYLLDLKTTNRSKEAPMGIYAENFLQLGAYAYAYREETGYEFYDVGIVNVGKDGRLSLATARDMNIEPDECERAFAFGVRLHDWLEKISPLTKDQSIKSCLQFSDSNKVDTESAG